MKTVTIATTNVPAQTTTVNVADNATIGQVLEMIEVQTFLGKSPAVIRSAFFALNGARVGGLAQRLLDSAPAAGDVISVDVRLTTAAPAGSAAGVPVNIQVKYNAGSQTCTLTGLVNGVTTVEQCLMNRILSDRFQVSTESILACDVVIRRDGTEVRVPSGQAGSTVIQAGDVIWLEAHAAAGKGINR